LRSLALFENQIVGVGERGLVLRMTSTGVDLFTADETLDLRKIVVDGQYLFAMGSTTEKTPSSVILRSRDGAKSWERLKIDDGAVTTHDLMMSSGNGLICAPDGKIFTSHDFGATWSSSPQVSESDLLSIAYLDQKHIWILGSNGTVLRLQVV
jgi:photosystem II stability/assembly factor-like uncharacterized protein